MLNDIEKTKSKDGLEELLNKYQSIRGISRATGVPKSTLFDRVLKYGLKSPYLNSIKGNVIFENKLPGADADDFDDYLEKVIALQSSLNNLNTKQVNLDLTIKDNKPIGVGFWGDWHIGAKGVDYAQWKADIATIERLSGFYYFGMGDFSNEAIEGSHKGEHYDELFNPDQQRKLVKEAVNRTAKSALGLTRGCHPDRVKSSTDTDIIEELCQVGDCANLWHGARINLTVGDVQYSLKVRHKAEGESKDNTTNAQRRQTEKGGEVDIVALAHLHFPDLQHKPYQGKSDVVWLRSGTYKIWDEYAQKLNGYMGVYGIPVLILYPKEKKIVPFKDFREGLKFLQLERS